MDNIFDILSSGKGTINEENISAFLGWLLTPAPKGLGDTFLEPVLKMMDIDMNEEDDIKKVKVILEAECQLEEHRRRYIDILIELPTKVIAIENKIWEQSKRVNQISEQRCGLENKYPKKEIINVLLSHENDKSETPNSITWNDLITEIAVSYTHLTLPTILRV